MLSLIALNLPVVEANCAPPGIRIDEQAGPTGTKVLVTGTGFMTRCADTNLVPPASPAKTIKVSFVQGKTEWLLAVVDADKVFKISAPVVVPADAVAGPGTFVADTVYEGTKTRVRPVAFIVSR
jgi:hypothetical protein